MRIVATVTAYNEEATIAGVLTTLLQCPSITHVQVVDDASTDATAEIVAGFPVALIRLPTRVPVGEAIMHHLPPLQDDDLLFWCDADLRHMTVQHVESTIANYFQRGVLQSISVKRIPLPGLRKLVGLRECLVHLFGAISGERLIQKQHFQQAIQVCQQARCPELLTGYGIVLFLNWFCRKHGRGSAMLYHPEIEHRQKYQKWSGRAVWWEMVKEWLQFAKVWLKIRYLSMLGRLPIPSASAN